MSAFDCRQLSCYIYYHAGRAKYFVYSCTAIYVWAESQIWPPNFPWCRGDVGRWLEERSRCDKNSVTCNYRERQPCWLHVPDCRRRLSMIVLLQISPYPFHFKPKLVRDTYFAVNRLCCRSNEERGRLIALPRVLVKQINCGPSCLHYGVPLPVFEHFARLVQALQALFRRFRRVFYMYTGGIDRNS